MATLPYNKFAPRNPDADKIILAHESKPEIWRATAVELTNGGYLCRLEKFIQNEWCVVPETTMPGHSYRFVTTDDPLEAYATLIKLLREDSAKIEMWLHPDKVIIEYDRSSDRINAPPITPALVRAIPRAVFKYVV